MLQIAIPGLLTFSDFDATPRGAGSVALVKSRVAVSPLVIESAPLPAYVRGAMKFA